MEETETFESMSIVVGPDGSHTTILEWLPLLAAFRGTVEWVLDIAADIAREQPTEVAAVERVRRFFRHRMDGYPASVRVRDALFTAGLVLAAIERDMGPLRTRGLSFKNPFDKLWHSLELAAERSSAKAEKDNGRIAA